MVMIGDADGGDDAVSGNDGDDGDDGGDDPIVV
jgi:hypothetical protein